MPTAGDRVRATLPALAVMALIFGVSSLSFSGASPPPIPHVDKLAHAIVYAVLGACLHHAAVRGFALARPALPAAALVAALYGGSDELHQRHVKGRDASLGDLAADAVGGLLGAGIAESRRRRALPP